MTKPNPADPIAEPLPGVDVPTGPESKIRAAVRRTIRAVEDEGLLRERDAAACALALELATAVDAGVARRSSSGVALAARELRETIDSLPKPPEGDPERDAFLTLMRDIAEAGDGRTVDAG